MRIRHLNLNHYEAARNFLKQTVPDLEFDILPKLCKDIDNKRVWIADSNGRAAPWT